MRYLAKSPWPDWECESKIGGGGFGTVYKIRRELGGSEEYAAMKVITVPENDEVIDDHRLRGETDESITKWFRNDMESIVKEYITMSKMKGHPNIVYCEDVKCVQHDDNVGWDIYIRMELLTPLKKKMEYVDSEEKIIDLGIAMCRALVKCHENGITHRDIKPENIFVSQDGIFKLGDFGIARTIEHTTTATLAGTYRYMAPEVYNDQKYSPAVDQYSLGLVLFQLLNGYCLPFFPKNPKQSDDENARKRRFDGEPIPAPANGSKQLQQIVLKACSYNPKQRYSSISEMLDALLALKSSNTNDSGKKDVESGEAAVEKDKVITQAEDVQSGDENGTIAALTIAALKQEKAVSESNSKRQESDVTASDENAHAYSTNQSGTNQNSHNNSENDINGHKPSVLPAGKVTPGTDNNHSIMLWISIATGILVLLGVIIYITRNKSPESGDRITPETDESLPVQLEWADWTDTLPDYVTLDNYDVEERTLYSSRQLEKTSSTESDKMDGWELYDSAIGNGDYGPWSDWRQAEILPTDLREVEQETRYRSRDKETTTSSSDSKSGWTLDDTTYSWGDYGPWSQWGTDKVSGSESREVQEETRYKYRDKEFMTSNSSSLTGWTKYDSSTSWGDWSSWSSWSTNEVSESESCDVDYKTQYRYRDLLTTTSTSSTLDGWFLFDSSVSYGSWSGWSTTPVSGSNTLDVETRQTKIGYRNKMAHYCIGYTGNSSTSYQTWNQYFEGSTYHELGWFSADLNDNMENFYPKSGGGWLYQSSSTSNCYRCSNTCYRWYIVDYEDVYRTEYRSRSKTITYYFHKLTDWSSYSDTPVSRTSTRDVETRTMYRYRTRNKVTTYYFYRFNDWSSWSTTAVSQSDNREVETQHFYRYRDRERIPTYHFSRWKEWSDWSAKEVQAKENREIEESTFYRFRERVTETTYYFRKWTNWSEYTESPIEESEDIEVQTKTEFRYKSKET